MDKTIKRINFSYENVYVDEECSRWFFSLEINAIFKMDASGSIKYVTSIKEYSYLSSGLFSAVSGWHNKIVFAPKAADFIVVLDRDSEEYEIVDLPEIIKNEYNTNVKFFSIIKNGNYMYMMGFLCPFILKLDMMNLCIKLIDLSKEPFLKWDTRGVFRNQYYTDEKYLYAPCLSGNYIFKMNMEDDHWIFCNMNDPDVVYSGMVFDGNVLWLSSMNTNKLTKLDLGTMQIETITIPIEWIKNQKYCYLDCDYIDNKVILFPGYDNPLLIYDIREKKFEKYQITNEKKAIAPVRCHYVYKNELLMVMDNSGIHMCLNNEDTLLICKPLDIDSNIFDKIIENCNSVVIKDNIIREEPFFGLKHLINNI